jgi:hypothetical protein
MAVGNSKAIPAGKAISRLVILLCIGTWAVLLMIQLRLLCKLSQYRQLTFSQDLLSVAIPALGLMTAAILAYVVFKRGSSWALFSLVLLWILAAFFLIVAWASRAG